MKIYLKHILVSRESLDLSLLVSFNSLTLRVEERILTKSDSKGGEKALLRGLLI